MQGPGGGAAAALAQQQALNLQLSSHKIMYCSRTHSQLQQVAKELDKTAYAGTRCVDVP